MIIVVGADAERAASHVSSWLGQRGRACTNSASLDAALADRSAAGIMMATTDLAGLMHSEETLQETARIMRIVVLYRVATLADIHTLPFWLRDNDDLHLVTVVDRDMADDWHWLTATVVVDQDAASWARALHHVRSILLPKTIMTVAICSTAVH